jgi:23S rRNA pseudouridine2457 synthase
MARLILFNKPYGVLSQFTDRSTDGAGDAVGYVDVPGVYPAGRLDRDSEGLLLLTDDGRLQARIADPEVQAAQDLSGAGGGGAGRASLEALRARRAAEGRHDPPGRGGADRPPSLWPRDPPCASARASPIAGCASPSAKAATARCAG